ncbi:outer membrane protein assembly factor [Spirosoma sp. RP8]|uniref:Outer membrane protein assembly factor n=1 Tax=Spirosoma liriopis TaxID=2937440 RepID=A0ABT0HPU9_9BACT|nr:BamA/TamA family outer membrane protein [Spirosoma liriopis]MCK8494190.1 outer membrane protein assembly factor [Spirosoma liriopis]
MKKIDGVRCMMYDWLAGRTLCILHHKSVVIVCMLTVALSGCLSSKKLQGDQYLLTAQTVKGNRTITREQLESLIPQRPNRRTLGLPITPPLWFYQLGLHSYNREAVLRELQAKTNEFEQQSQQLANQPKALKKLNRRFSRQAKKLRLKAEEGNWLMRNLGEPPSYFAERDAQTNAAKMQKYLSDKGFFHARTAYKLDTLRRRQIRVNYLITENAGFYLRTVRYEIDDPRVDSLVRSSLNVSKLKSGDRFDLDNISGEKVRIESLLRDQGYYTFSRQYIPVTDLDTTRRSTERLPTADTLRRNIDVYLRILNPPGQSAHPIYRIGDVEVRISPDEQQSPVVSTELDTVKRNGITYLLGGRNISSRILDSKIRIRPGELYSQTNYRETQRSLFLLNQFKFVNLNFIDTTNRRLRALVTATPLDKYEATAESGVTVLYQGQGYPGGFGNLTFRVRNLFGGLETFETSIRYGFEAQTGFLPKAISERQVYSSQELGISSSLIFPQIIFPSRLRFLFNTYNPRTQLSISYNNSFRPDFRRSLLRASMAYNWQISPTKQFNFLIADINLINAGAGTDPLVSNSFYEQVDSLFRLGSTIYLGFRRSFASGISLAYTYNTNTVGQNRRANFLRTVVESGGTTLNFFSDQQLRQLFSLRDINGQQAGLQYYKYLRLNVDYRHYYPIRSRTTLAFRVNTGLVYGYGPTNGVPYEKLFFAGGSNSVRAWLPRRLGPGAAFPFSSNPNFPDVTQSGQFVYLFEQPGNILLEGSAELRGRLFHLFADVNGAIFVDAGNVWTLNNSRPGSVFRLNTFVPQIAVGTGVGLRFDFSFFVVRFDGGIKVWDPARQYLNDIKDGGRDERFILPKFSLKQLSSGPNPLVINFGIGYPF